MPKSPANPSPVSVADASPEELALRAQHGSLACYAELVARFEGRLYNFLLRRTSISTDAEDLTQETFVRAWQRIANYSPRWRFSTWLFTIAARLAISHHRDTSRARPRDAAWARRTGERVEAPVPRDREGFDRLWDLALRVLSEEQRTALWLRYAEEMGIAEIATILGRTQVSVRVLLFRSRKTLATLMEKQTADEEERSRAAAVGHMQAILSRGVARNAVGAAS